MARIKVRYLVERPGAEGALPRWFWQPSTALRKEGWQPQRVPADWARFADPLALQAAAITAAQQLNAALDARRGPVAGPAPAAEPARTLGRLIREYQLSADWRALAPATQRGYRQCLTRLQDWAGDAPIRAVDEVRVQRLKARMADTPAFAAAVLRVLRLLLEHGRRNGWRPWLPTNPAERPGLTGAEPSGLIWPQGAVAAFVAAADAMGRHSAGTAVMLNEWLGQREGDILRMPRSALRQGTLMVRQGKTKAGVQLPIAMVAAVAARLDAELGRRAATPEAHIIVNEDTGRPYKPDNFRHVFARIRARAAETHPHFEVDYLLPGRDMADVGAFQVRMAELTFMHLRHTAVTRLAEAGCDAPLIASVTGHSPATVTSLLRRYMVRTGTMARAAFQKRLDAEGGE